MTYPLPPNTPAELTPDSFADRLYAMLGPLARDDSHNYWSLLILCNAIGQMFQLLDDWLRDTPAGPGWSLLLDLERCPDEALPWLGQFVGVRIPAGMTPDQARARIASTDGFRRGTRAALIGALQPTLTGAKTVLFHERSGDVSHTPEYAYYLTVRTYTSQTPDVAASRAALLAQNPGGIVLDYAAVVGQSWQQVKDSGRTWAQVKAAYASWDAVRSDQPS